MSSSEEALSLLGKWKREQTSLKLTVLAEGEDMRASAASLPVFILDASREHVLYTPAEPSAGDLFIPISNAQKFSIARDGTSLEITLPDRTRFLFIQA